MRGKPHPFEKLGKKNSQIATLEAGLSRKLSGGEGRLLGVIFIHLLLIVFGWDTDFVICVERWTFL